MPSVPEPKRATREHRKPYLSFPGWPTLGIQVLLGVLAALAYFGVRGLTESKLVPAQANARSLVEVERALWMQREGWLQDQIIEHDQLVTLANWIYIYGHWPVIVASLVWLFMRAPQHFYVLRNAMFISGAIGLLFFVLFPVAPPRLGVLDLADTVTLHSTSYRTFQPPGLIDRYAAFPSLHFGWNLLVGITLWRASHNVVLRVFAVLMPIAMAWAVVATGNHYAIDVLGGGIIALIGLAGAHWLMRLHPPPAWARPPT